MILKLAAVAAADRFQSPPFARIIAGQVGAKGRQPKPESAIGDQAKIEQLTIDESFRDLLGCSDVPLGILAHQVEFDHCPRHVPGEVLAADQIVSLLL